MPEVSEGQRLTRRRAMGRRLIRKASDLSVLCGDIHGQDLEYLTGAERAKFDKLVKQLRVVSQHLDKMGTEMDKS